MTDYVRRWSLFAFSAFPNRRIHPLFLSKSQKLLLNRPRNLIWFPLNFAIPITFSYDNFINSTTEYLVIINLKQHYGGWIGKFINFHDKSFQFFFSIEISISVIFFNGGKSRALSGERGVRKGGWMRGEKVSCFIHIYRFSFFTFLTARLGNTFFQLISIELFLNVCVCVCQCLCMYVCAVHVHVCSIFYRRRLFVVVFCVLFYSCFSTPPSPPPFGPVSIKTKKNENCFRESIFRTIWGDMYWHYVAFAIDEQSVRHFHVCLCDNLHIWPHRMICRSFTIHTGD